MKKGQGLSLNTMAVAVLVVLVVVVVALIFQDVIKDSIIGIDATRECANHPNAVDGNACMTRTDCSAIGGQSQVGLGCEEKVEGELCCLSFD